MIEAITQTGFKISLEEEKFDDWNFLGMLRKLDRGDSGLIYDVGEFLLGDKLDELVKHVEDLNGGKASIVNVTNEIRDILTMRTEDTEETTVEDDLKN